jgi:predicted dehydrogenase
MSMNPGTAGTKRIRVGIIGANPNRGWAAEGHIPALKSLADDFEINALSTSRRESADAAAKRFGVAAAYVRFARDYREGTHLCPTFDDAVTRHRMLDAIEKAAATGQRQTLG